MLRTISLRLNALFAFFFFVSSFVVQVSLASNIKEESANDSLPTLSIQEAYKSLSCVHLLQPRALETLKVDESYIPFDEQGCPDYSEYNKKRIFQGEGGNKVALGLFEGKTVLVPKVRGPEVDENRWSRLITRECKIYNILNQVGLISQQAPSLYNILFHDGRQFPCFVVDSFEQVARRYNSLIFDVKILKSTGDISLFSEEISNFTNNSYWLNMLKPLAKDIAKWVAIGCPGTWGDSVNYIFIKKSDGEVICRALFFDIYIYRLH